MVASKAEMRKQIVARTGDRPIVAWLSPDEAALYCSLSLGTFTRLIQDSVVTKKLGRRILVSVASLDNYMQGLTAHKGAKKKLPARVL